MPSSSGNTTQGSAGTGPSSGRGSSIPPALPGIPKDVLAAVGGVGASDAATRRSTAKLTQLDDTIRQLQSSGDSDASSKIANLRAEYNRSEEEELRKLKSQGSSGVQGSDKSSGA